MPMPKTTVNKNYFLLRWKNQVRFAGKIRAVQSIPVTGVVDQPTHKKLRLGITVPD
jgi:hypothetical protein